MGKLILVLLTALCIVFFAKVVFVILGVGLGAAFGAVVGSVGAAIGVVGGLLGAAVGLLGGLVGLAAVLIVPVLIVMGIIFLVKALV